MIKSLSQKELGHALFFSIKMDDFQHALYLLRLDAPVNTSYFVDQDRLVYTSNLIVGKVAETLRKYGAAHAKSRLLLTILDFFIEKKPDLRCHCSSKNPHYCAMSEAFRHINFDSEADLFVEQNLLILKLLYHGATFRNLNKSKEFKWTGIDQLVSFIETKKGDALELLRTNRHSKCTTKQNRHSQCALNYKAQKAQRE